MAISEKELDTVMELSPEKRYFYFIQRICDYEKVWVLTDQDDSFALYVDKKDKEFLYLFPLEEFAEQFLLDEIGFEEYKPQKIKLSKFINNLIPLLHQDKVNSAHVFPIFESHGLSVDFDKIIRDINLALEELAGKNEYKEKEKVKKYKE